MTELCALDKFKIFKFFWVQTTYKHQLLYK